MKDGEMERRGQRVKGGDGSDGRESGLWGTGVLNE